MDAQLHQQTQAIQYVITCRADSTDDLAAAAAADEAACADAALPPNRGSHERK